MVEEFAEGRHSGQRAAAARQQSGQGASQSQSRH
jgi:hypothetical protein